MGYLAPGPSPLFTDLLIPALRERGWVVGRTLVVETRYTQGDPARAQALAEQLVQERVDVIVTNFTATTMAARRDGTLPTGSVGSIRSHRDDVVSDPFPRRTSLNRSTTRADCFRSPAAASFMT